MCEIVPHLRKKVPVENESLWQERSAKRVVDRAAALRHAIEAGEIQPYYQPIVDLPTRRTTGFEVLARWVSTSCVTECPDEFIPLAAATGQLNLLTKSLLRNAIQEASRWPAHLTLAINVAPSQFEDERLPELIASCACSQNFPLSRLVVEVTEDALRGSPERAIETANQLRELGVQLAMDDFGMGESNIRRLGVVEFDILKVDRSVIQSLTPEARTHRGLLAALAVGNSLGLQVIAEGVEAEWQAAVIGLLGCCTLQGWLTGRPVPASELPSSLYSGDAAHVVGSSFRRAPSHLEEFAGRATR